jgi:hypothetical protein
MLSGLVHTIEKNAEALVVASKESGLEVLVILSAWSCLRIRMQDEFTVYFLASRGVVSFSRRSLLHGVSN